MENVNLRIDYVVVDKSERLAWAGRTQKWGDSFYSRLSAGTIKLRTFDSEIKLHVLDSNTGLS